MLTVINNNSGNCIIRKLTFELEEKATCRTSKNIWSTFLKVVSVLATIPVPIICETEKNGMQLNKNDFLNISDLGTWGQGR